MPTPHLPSGGEAGEGSGVGDFHASINSRELIHEVHTLPSRVL